MTLRVVQLLPVLAAVTPLAAPQLACAQDSSAVPDSVYLYQKVLPPDYPTGLFQYVGEWSLTLTRDHSSRSLTVDVALAPDSVSRIFLILHLNHSPCMACLGAPISPPWDQLLSIPPPARRLTVSMEDSTIYASIGVPSYVMRPGGLVFRGKWVGDSVVGTWQQRESPDSAHGAFVMSRKPTHGD